MFFLKRSVHSRNLYIVFVKLNKYIQSIYEGETVDIDLGLVSVSLPMDQAPSTNSLHLVLNREKNDNN